MMTDLRELAAVLDLNPNDPTEAKKLLFFAEYATRIIEEVLNRPGFSYKARTEYYDGTGTAKLLLRSRPVYTSPVIQVFVDDNGFYGQFTGAFSGTNAALTYGTDFVLKVDQEDGTSRSGMLIKIPTSGGSFGGGTWNKPYYRQAGYLSPYLGEAFGNIKVIYYAGYTLDTLPAQIRLAANLLVARLRLLFPLGMFLTSESYEDRSVSYSLPERDKLLELIWPLIFTLRNHKF